MTTLRLILGDQLNPEHGWFSVADEQTALITEYSASAFEFPPGQLSRPTCG